ncbi:hypothetical protein [Natrinema limicola]|uniref:Uncharacterized protein n=1 Tax=Natrinema limicola JCM 13563 TaxID=1230457 RepID=M0C274_9EURY|nr:hypothetical protein [Natrinema limicola]ELZ17391.1 hypothetical protein C476_15595 [Natrinema limicola JCM 13563]
MARDESVRDTTGPAEQTVSDDERNNTSVIDRRSYLKLAGATVLATGVSAGAASAAGNDYEVIEARGQTITIDSGQTWENKLIDFGNRNEISIIAKGTNWTIRNIGFTGTIPYNTAVFGVCDSGSGTSVMENIYFGESTGEQPASTRSICIWVDPKHNGHLDVTNVNFNVPGNNGIYGSAPAYNGNGGTVALDSCYGNDCHHTAFRIGDNGMSIDNCMSYKSGTRAANRNAWIWEGKYDGGATIRNSHFITNGAGDSIATNGNPNLTIDNVHTDDGHGDGSNPEHFVPDGCPKSGEEAASGGSSNSASSSPSTDEDADRSENTLLVDGVGTAGDTRYEFTVSGAAEKATIKGATIDDGDSIESGHVTGRVAGWRDAFRFAGDLEELTIEGDARVFVNGERVDPADYGQEKPHVLTLVGNGTTANYELTVDGTIETIAGDDSEEHATVSSGNTVEGSIERASQQFRFSGTLTDITFLDGSAQVYVDDQRIDPKQYNEQELLPHAIVIDGTDTDGRTEYAFSVDGEVITSSYRDASVNPGDEIDGRSVSGKVDDGLDAYWFDGDIADFQLSGNATVDVEYNARSN